MKGKLYKELWTLRFKKMLSLEVNSVVEYEALLAECKKHYANHSVLPLFETLIADEKKHTRLVQELLEILKRQAD